MPAPIGLGKRMHLDQVVGGVLVNLDGLCEAVICVSRRITQKAVIKGDKVQTRGLYQEFQGDGLVLVLGSPHLKKRVHVLFHDHVFGSVRGLTNVGQCC